MDELTTLLSCAPETWTAALEATFTEQLRALLVTTRTVRFTVPCTSRLVWLYWADVATRVLRQNADVIHTGGTRWDGAAIYWNFSGWPPATEDPFRDFSTFKAIEQVKP